MRMNTSDPEIHGDHYDTSKDPAFSGTSQTPCSVECKQCVELARVLSALLADYEHVVFDEGHGGPIGNMVLARTLLNDITQNT